MSNARVDEIKELYDKSDIIRKWTNALFIINIILSFALLFSFDYRSFVIYLSMSFNFIYVVITSINDMFFSNYAENERRKSLLKESFSINITLRRTNKYYNNNERPSIKKMGLNCYESAFYTKKIVDKMIVSNAIKTILIFIIYLILMCTIDNLDVILIITQTLFSVEVIFSFVKLLYYKFQLDEINKNFEKIFFILDSDNNTKDVLIVDTTMDYECLKSYCKISISTKIFTKYRDNWSKEWKNLLKRIND